MTFFCLQETYQKAEDTFTFKGFNTYNHIHSDCLRASGGSSIFVHFSCPQREIKLNIDLQDVAVSVTLEKEITFIDELENLHADRTTVCFEP